MLNKPKVNLGFKVGLSTKCLHAHQFEWNMYIANLKYMSYYYKYKRPSTQFTLNFQNVKQSINPYEGYYQNKGGWIEFNLSFQTVEHILNIYQDCCM